MEWGKGENSEGLTDPFLCGKSDYSVDLDDPPIPEYNAMGVYGGELGSPPISGYDTLRLEEGEHTDIGWSGLHPTVIDEWLSLPDQPTFPHWSESHNSSQPFPHLPLQAHDSHSPLPPSTTTDTLPYITHVPDMVGNQAAVTGAACVKLSPPRSPPPNDVADPTAGPSGLHGQAADRLPNFQVGTPHQWEDLGHDMTVNYAKPGTFGTHTWLECNSHKDRTAQQSPITCMLCGTLLTPKEFEPHLSCVHRVTRVLLTSCFVCDKLVSVLHLNMHLSAVHKVTPSMTAAAWMPLGLKHDEVTKAAGLHGDNRCEECGNKFSSPAGLRQHAKASHPPADADFRCTKCAASYKTQTAIANHMFKSHNHQCWRCQFCGLEYRFKKDLSRHINTKHESADTRKCYQCDGEFTSLVTYTRHIREAHAGEGFFHCLICRLTFDHVNSFKSHACQLSL